MPRTFSRRTRSTAIAGAIALLAVTAYAQMRIAVVDTQRAVMETEEGLRAAANLKKVFDSRQRELDQKQNALQKERGEIEKQRGVLSKEALATRVQTWERDMLQVQQVFVEYNKEMQKQQSEVTQPIFQKVMGIIRRIATADGYDVVIDRQAVPYFRSDLDLTDRVITAYNRGDTAAPATAPAAGSAAPAKAAP